MKSLLIILLVSSLVFSSCAESTERSIDNIPRLVEINRILTSGNAEKARVEATQYVQDYPHSFQGWGLRGWVSLDFDEVESAVGFFDKALILNPKWDNAYVGKGVAFRKLGDNHKARAAYLQAISIAPKNPEAFSSLLVIELSDGNSERAVEYGEKAWALRKDHPNIAANLAVAYHYFGNQEKRDLYFEHAVRLGYSNIEAVRNIFNGTDSIR